MSSDSKPVALGTLLLRPTGFVGSHFDNLPQTARFPGISFVIRTVIRILHIGEIQSARRPDQVEHVLHRIPFRAMSQLVSETLNCEAMVDVGHRSQPANPDMSVSRTILDAYVRQIVGKIRPTLCQVR